MKKDNLTPEPARLPEYVARTVKLLNNLTATVDEQGHKKKPAMPTSALRQAKGLAIFIRSKWGCLGNFTKERGFVIARLPDGAWSAPVFMSARHVGLGLSLGYYRSGMCLACVNDAAVPAFTRERASLGVAAEFLVNMDGARVRPVALDSADAPESVADVDGARVAKYYRLRAMMVDYSVKFRRAGRWARMNRALYGPGVEAEAVLRGDAAPPVEFLPVYQLLNRLAAAQPAAHPHHHLDKAFSVVTAAAAAAGGGHHAGAGAAAQAAGAGGAGGGSGGSGSGGPPAGTPGKRRTLDRNFSQSSLARLAAPAPPPAAAAAAAGLSADDAHRLARSASSESGGGLPSGGGSLLFPDVHIALAPPSPLAEAGSGEEGGALGA